MVVKGGLDGKESAYNSGNSGLMPGLEISPGEGNDYPLQYSSRRILQTEEPVNYSPWGHKESDLTERLSTATMNNSDSYSSAQYKYIKSL